MRFTTTITRECVSCGGSGETACPTCDGPRECEDCDGFGEVDLDVEVEYDTIEAGIDIRAVRMRMFVPLDPPLTASECDEIEAAIVEDEADRLRAAAEMAADAAVDAAREDR